MADPTIAHTLSNNHVFLSSAMARRALVILCAVQDLVLIRNAYERRRAFTHDLRICAITRLSPSAAYIRAKDA